MYLISTLLLIASLLLYFKIADRYNIIDKPNERSSHSSLTIRGGGIVFSVAVLMAFIMGYAGWPLTLAVLLVATVSFVDDIRPLSQLPRFSVHIIGSLLVLYEVGLFQWPLWWIPLALFVLLGWVNIFNFMDGINGITVLYSLVAIVSFGLLPVHEGQRELLILVGISCLVFGFFNVRKKAKAFAGDVGSVAMALFLGYFMAKTLILTQNPFYLLFFTVYGIDAAITIFYRLSRKENIFQPHRTHLYQYLANELKVPHVTVSGIYATVQLALNLLLIYGIGMDQISYIQGIAFVMICCLIYLWLRRRVTKRISLQRP